MARRWVLGRCCSKTVAAAFSFSSLLSPATALSCLVWCLGVEAKLEGITALFCGHTLVCPFLLAASAVCLLMNLPPRSLPPRQAKFTIFFAFFHASIRPNKPSLSTTQPPSPYIHADHNKVSSRAKGSALARFPTAFVHLHRPLPCPSPSSPLLACCC